jgi:hypothetical protein
MREFLGVSREKGESWKAIALPITRLSVTVHGSTWEISSAPYSGRSFTCKSSFLEMSSRVG